MRMLIAFAAALCACVVAAPDLLYPRAAAAPAPASEIEQRETLHHWSRSCALCHATGTGGAPRLGHPEDWRPRLARGRESLLSHTIEGFNNMPPLGYCMACEREDFIALIDFMLGDADPPPPEKAP